MNDTPSCNAYTSKGSNPNFNARIRHLQCLLGLYIPSIAICLLNKNKINMYGLKAF